jgi:hypothetical protein
VVVVLMCRLVAVNHLFNKVPQTFEGAENLENISVVQKKQSLTAYCLPSSAMKFHVRPMT